MWGGQLFYWLSLPWTGELKVETSLRGSVGIVAGSDSRLQEGWWGGCGLCVLLTFKPWGFTIL